MGDKPPASSEVPRWMSPAAKEGVNSCKPLPVSGG